MRHHGKIAKDTENGIWSGHCTCTLTWDTHRFNDTRDAVVRHIESQARIARFGGVGFRADIAR